jgi:hypothetical protein
MSTANALGMLRHLYAQMVGGHVTNPMRAAMGLLSPAIREIERIEQERSARASENTEGGPTRAIPLNRDGTPWPAEKAAAYWCDRFIEAANRAATPRCNGRCHCHAGADGLMHPPCCDDCARALAAPAIRETGTPGPWVEDGQGFRAEATDATATRCADCGLDALAHRSLGTWGPTGHPPRSPHDSGGGTPTEACEKCEHPRHSGHPRCCPEIINPGSVEEGICGCNHPWPSSPSSETREGRGGADTDGEGGHER